MNSDPVGCLGLIALAILVGAILLVMGVGFVRFMEAPP